MLFQIFSLILQAITGLVAGACLMRLYMQWMRVPLSGNPMAPFVFALSNWLVLPLRRFVPALGRLDTASLVGAYGAVLVKFVILWLITESAAPWLALLLAAVFELVNSCVSGLTWLIIIYAVLSWVRAGSDIGYFLAQLVEPLLSPIRRVMPQLGGIDLSPLALLLLLQIAEIVLHNLQMQLML
jgi:YggT family protein